MVGVREGRRSWNLSVTGEGGAVEVFLVLWDGDGVTPGWVDDPVRQQDGRQCLGGGGGVRSGMPPRTDII